MKPDAVAALESDIVLTRARLHESVAAIAAKLERFEWLTSARPAAAAALALGLGLLLGSPAGRRLARRRLMGVAAVTAWGALVAALARRPERRRLPPFTTTEGGFA